MSLLIVFIPVYFLNRHALRFFDHFARTDLENHLKHYAAVMAWQYRTVQAKPDPERKAEFERLLRVTAEEIGATIQIVDLYGRVVHDSDDPSNIGTDLMERPEIAEAVRGAYSARARLTPDRRYMVFYIARPIKDDAKNVLGVAYVVRHTGPIMRAITRMVRNQRLATYLALALAAVAATVLAMTLTRRLRALTRAAKRFAEGSGPLETDIRGGDEIAELNRAVHEMAGEIASREQYNRDFVGTTLHELKTPLTAIKGAAEILKDGASREPAARAKFAGNILYQTDRMMRLVGELRELTRHDADERRLRGQRIDYAAFVRESLERLGETFPDPHAALHLDLPAFPVPVIIVPHRIEQVLSNLLDNAFRYTPASGSVTVRVRAPRDGDVLTSVEDTGCGIESTDLPRVFDRFFTTEKHDARRDYGSGLGLAIAQRIVRNHRGRIWAESNGGARFFFTLPAA
jgi:signal transduction histidine kinase